MTEVRDDRPSVYGMLSALLDEVEAHAGVVPDGEWLLRRLVARDRDLLAAAAVYRMRAAPMPDGGDLDGRLRSAVSAKTLDDEISRALQLWTWLVEHKGKGAVMGRRGKYVLSRPELHRALGLRPDVSVVGVHITRDPDAVHVTVEGDGVPEFPIAGGDVAAMAWVGTVEAPVLRWPEPAGPGPAGGVTVNECPGGEPAGGGGSESGPARSPLTPAGHLARCADEAESAVVRGMLRGGIGVDGLDLLLGQLRQRALEALAMRDDNVRRGRVLNVLEEFGVSPAAVDRLSAMLSEAAGTG